MPGLIDLTVATCPGALCQREQVGEADLAREPGDRAERGGEIGAGGAEACRWRSRPRALQAIRPVAGDRAAHVGDDAEGQPGQQLGLEALRAKVRPADA